METSENPKFYKQLKLILKKAQQSLSGKIDKSQNWLDDKLQLARKWEHLINQFKRYIYQEVNKIVENNDVIKAEDLNVRNMLIKKLGGGKKGLRRNLASVKLGILLKIFADKVEDTGRQLIWVNPKNTSQTRSNCYELVESKLTLRDRMFECCNCSLKLDRDINSARNVLNLGFNTQGFDRNPPLQSGKEL